MRFDTTFLAVTTDSYTIFRDFTETMKLEIHFKLFKDSIPTYRQNYVDQPVKIVQVKYRVFHDFRA